MKKSNYPKKDIKRREKRLNDDNKLSGFTTLNQVAGVPKAHSYHSRIPVAPTRTIKEPLVKCAICSEVIQNISQGMYNPNGELVHFDCVLDEIKKSHPVRENQAISYIGKGTFALVEKDSEGKWSIIERYVFENNESFERMKAYVEESRA